MSIPITRRLAALLALVFAAAGLSGFQTPPEGDEPPTSRPEEESALAYVLMQTSEGAVVLELNRQKAPASVKNFLAYVDDEFYDGTIFHRVVPGFVVQGGGFTSDMTKKRTRDPIRNESDNGLANARGTLAMARTNVIDSATSQFYINLKDNAALDGGGTKGNGGYAVFATVVAGMSVVDGIAAAPTGLRGGMRDVPLEPIVIEKTRRITRDEATKLMEAETK